MASIGSVLKDEITRLARRELRRQVEPFKKASAAHRRHIASLKRQVAQLQKQVKAAGRVRPAAATPAGEEGGSSRFVAKGLKTLRARLGLSAAEFGKLVGVSGQSVYNWESKKAVPRRAQVATIASLRSLGKREARARLDGDAAPAAEAPKKQRRSKAAASPKKAAAKRVARKRAAAPRKRKARKAG